MERTTKQELDELFDEFGDFSPREVLAITIEHCIDSVWKLREHLIRVRTEELVNNIYMINGRRITAPNVSTATKRYKERV